MSEKLRTVRFAPYLKGKGPIFSLSTWDAGERWEGTSRRTYLKYRLTIRQPQEKRARVLFEGDDFGCGMGLAIDSDGALRSLMGFLTLRPGDTDADYFDSYTPAQRAYCESHAEALSMAVFDRFGEG